MKRMHVGMKVEDRDQEIAFYARLFGTGPTLRRPVYAKWMLDDPRVNFSIDSHGKTVPGSTHYGIQIESREELEEMRRHIDELALPRSDRENFICGYQRQDAFWVTDPYSVTWETFFTYGVVDS